MKYYCGLSPSPPFLSYACTHRSSVVRFAAMDTIALVLAALGFISIIGSIVIWNIKKGETAEEKAHAERFGIFIGLWAPTFFALAVLAKLM